MGIVRNGTLTKDSAVVTGLAKTNDLRVGWYVYGNKLPIKPKIQSIDSATQITMTKNALDNGTESLDFSYVTIGVLHERNCALIDSKNIIDERGDEVTFIMRNEDKVTRGNYGGIIKKEDSVKYYFKAFPISWNPNIYTLQKAGLREEAEIALTMAYKDFLDNVINFEDIDINRGSVIVQGSSYEIKEKGKINHFADAFLNITFGLFKR